MEKFGLFDLIDKLNLSANGKKEFSKSEKEQAGGDTPPQKNGFIDPMIYPPKHYMMNEKMIDFCKKHDEFKKSITPLNK